MPEVEAAPQPQPHSSSHHHHDVNDFNMDLQSAFNSQTTIVTTQFNSTTPDATMNGYTVPNGGQSIYSHPQGGSCQDHWQLQPEQQLQQQFQQAQQLQLQQQIQLQQEQQQQQQQQQLQQQQQIQQQRQQIQQHHHQQEQQHEQQLLQRVKQQQLEQDIHEQQIVQHQQHLEQLQKIQIKQQQHQSQVQQFYQLQTQQQYQQQQQQQQPNLSLGTFQNNEDNAPVNNHSLVHTANKIIKQENDITDIADIPQILNYNQGSQYVVGNAVSQNTFAVPQSSLHTNMTQAQSGIVYNVDPNVNQLVTEQHNIPIQHVSVPQAPPPTQPHTQPTYVNAKQYHRILKRREARHRLEEYYAKKRNQSVEEGIRIGDKRVRNDIVEVSGVDGNDSGGSRRPYIHESRHKHAMKRPRGPSGRFLTKDELVEYYKNHPEEDPRNFKS